MREIKCRGQRKDNGEWIYGWLIRVYAERYFIAPEDDLWFVETDEYNRKIEPTEFNGFVEVIPETVREFTGLNDSFANDIVKAEIEGFQEIGIVEWDEEKAQWGWRHPKDNIYYPLWEIFSIYKGEVIGNIHENPDLLKEDKK